MKHFIVLLLIVACTYCFIFDNRKSFQGYKVYRCKLTSEEQILKVRVWENEGKIDIWSQTIGKDRMDIMVSPDFQREFELDFLMAYNVPYLIFMDNVAQKIEDEFYANLFAPDEWHKKYHNYPEIIQWMKEINQKYPKYTKLVHIGESYEKRPLYALEINKPSKITNKKIMLYTAGMHAREWIGPASMMYLIDKLLQDIGTNSTMDGYLDYIAFHIVTVTNVDGYVYTHENNRMWRKTRAPSGSGCYGTDANRNFNWKWGSKGSSSNPCSETFHGKTAESEVEIKQLVQYIKTQVPNLHTFIDWHSYSQLFMRPWGHSTEIPKDEPLMKKVGDAAAQAMRSVYGTKFESGRIAVIIYAVSGSSTDWVYGTFGKQGYAVELQDTGRYGFLLPPEKIIPQGEEIYAAVKSMCENAMQN